MSEQWDDTAPAPQRQDGVTQVAALEQWNEVTEVNEVNVYQCTTSKQSGAPGMAAPRRNWAGVGRRRAATHSVVEEACAASTRL
jgi:hypothetical protein